jgi:hypothetical protein
MKFNITRHCKNRYIERVLGGLNNSPNIFLEILNMLNSATNITSKLSEENPRFILYLKERYGIDKGYNFLKKDNVIFVLSKHKGTKNLYEVITCYIKHKHIDKFKNTILSNDEIHLRLRQLKKEK